MAGRKTSRPRSKQKKSDALAPFHPIVSGWFRDTLGAPSAPQREGWPAIGAGHHTLILAPTGTGKTLAAFLWELNAPSEYLAAFVNAGYLRSGTSLRYLTPV